MGEAPAPPRGRRLGVRARLVLLATGVLALGIVVASVLMVVAVRVALLGSLDDAGRQRAADVALLLQRGSLPDPLPVTGSAAVQVLDGGLRVLATSPGGDRLAPLVGAGAVAAVRSGQTVVVGGARVGSPEPLRVVGVPAGPGGDATVLVATSAAEVDRALRVVRGSLAAGVPLLLAGTALLAWRVAGSALRPVEALRAGAEQIAGVPGHPSPTGAERSLPVPASGDEVARLALTLNAMLARLDSASARQREFVADAAHELRSPLASVRAQLEVAAARPGDQDWPTVVGDVLVDIDRMAALVGDLLVLARLDALAPLAEPVDLAQLVRAEVARTSWGRRVEVVADGPAVVLAPESALTRVVTNLVANAARHARSQVVVRLDVDQGWVVLDVEDDGPGIAVADRELVFERFARLDAARARGDGGTGLGLAIVRTVVTRLGGDVTARDGRTLPGALVRVRLPGSRSPAQHASSG